MAVVNEHSQSESAMQRVLDRLDRAAQEEFMAEMTAAIERGDDEPARILHEWLVSTCFRGTVMPESPNVGPVDLDKIASSHGIDMDELRRSWADTSSTTAST